MGAARDQANGCVCRFDLARVTRTPRSRRTFSGTSWAASPRPVDAPLLPPADANPQVPSAATPTLLQMSTCIFVSSTQAPLCMPLRIPCAALVVLAESTTRVARLSPPVARHLDMASAGPGDAVADAAEERRSAAQCAQHSVYTSRALYRSQSILGAGLCSTPCPRIHLAQHLSHKETSLCPSALSCESLNLKMS